MIRARVVLICLLALAMLPAGLAARSAPRMPATAFATVSDTLAEARGEAVQAKATKPTRPCMRGVLPLAPCGADLALPGPGLRAHEPGRGMQPVAGGTDVLSGLPPACILGPPRSC